MDFTAEIAFSKKYVEDMLSFYGMNVDVAVQVVDDEIVEINIPSTNMNGFLIGQHGDVLRAIQFLTSSALVTKGFELRRCNVDVADYKKQRNERLAAQAKDWSLAVAKSNAENALRPMNAGDRRIVHQVAAEVGIVSESAGEGRTRHVVLKPKV